MKAAQLTKYNKKAPQILISNASLPPLGLDDLLIQVKAAGVNPLDNLIAHGDLKLVTPYKLSQILGNEFVGVVQLERMLLNLKSVTVYMGVTH